MIKFKLELSYTTNKRELLEIEAPNVEEGIAIARKYMFDDKVNEVVLKGAGEVIIISR